MKGNASGNWRRFSVWGVKSKFKVNYPLKPTEGLTTVPELEVRQLWATFYR